MAGQSATPPGGEDPGAGGANKEEREKPEGEMILKKRKWSPLQANFYIVGI